MQAGRVNKCFGSTRLNLSQYMPVLVRRPNSDVDVEFFRPHYNLACRCLATRPGECRLCETVKNQACKNLPEAALRGTAGGLRGPFEHRLRFFEQCIRGAVQMGPSQCHRKVLPALQLSRAL